MPSAVKRVAVFWLLGEKKKKQKQIDSVINSGSKLLTKV